MGSWGSVMFVTGAAIAAAAFVGLVFGANKILSPNDPIPDKLEAYECGMPAQGQPNIRVRLRYVTIAVAFVIFDAESVLLFAVSSRLRGSFAALGVVGIFTALLVFGLAYAWRKDALQWHL
jgi:NADH:ubiquinone oxidoreductase subunit 3 (subunit A)